MNQVDRLFEDWECLILQASNLLLLSIVTLFMWLKLSPFSFLMDFK